jgi:hypothetical protein
VSHEDPFAGMRLSEQTGMGKLDQQLFGPARPPVTSAESKSSPPPTPPAQTTNTEARTASPARLQAVKAAPAAVPRFNLMDEPLRNATFVFTDDELEALEDLKLELRRELGKKVTKYDLVRAGLHLLFEDHVANGDRSYATRKIRKKPG